MTGPNSAELRTCFRSACLVAADAASLDADGSLLARVRQLIEQGTAVHVHYCGPGRAAGADAAARRFREAGAGFSSLDLGDAPIPFQVRNIVESGQIGRGDAVRHTLTRLVKQHGFDLIEFGAAGGLGFRAVQAKQGGLGFADVCLAVRLDACGAWIRDRECRWPSGLAELEVDFAERYSFEHADVRICPCPVLLEFVRRIGWDDRCGPDDLPGLARSPSPRDADGAWPLVTVAIPHYNLGRYLPDALASVAAQTYPRLEVVVIDDGSTDRPSLDVFAQMQSLYPSYRFLRQANAGIGASRNRGLQEAAGEYFIPMDADNIARPDMVERFVTGIRRNPGLSAMTCYFLAFKDGVPPAREQYLYAYRPAGGPHALAAIRNVYGDANAIFRTAEFRAVGGYETDRDASFEDWEAFVKLVHAGRRVGVIPEHLFYYRHRDAGFSRVTDDYRNRQRVLRQFLHLERLPPAERAVLWTALYSFHRRAEQTRELTRYRLADRLHALCGRLPFAIRGLKWLIGRAAG